MDRKIPKPSFSTRRRFKHFCTAFLLGSVSLYAVKSLYELEPETFSKSSVVLNKDTVDIRDFYDNLSYDLKQKAGFTQIRKEKESVSTASAIIGLKTIRFTKTLPDRNIGSLSILSGCAIRSRQKGSVFPPIT